MPPRHGKSELISTYFPVWYLNLYPARRIILSSYEATFAASWGRRVRNLIADNQDKLDVRLSSDMTAADWWQTNEGGGMATAGVGGSITGKGCDILIIDDYLKNSEDAASSTIRNKIWDWYTSTAYTRLEPDGAVVVLATRWHEDDLIGRLMLEDGWDVISLPAIAEDDDLIGRKSGEPLWSERFPLNKLQAIRKTLGSYYWSAMYQCSPAPATGSIVQRSWWRRYTSLPSMDRYVISVDCSFSGKDTSDYNVFQCWGKSGADYYLIDQDRFKGDFPFLIARFKSFCAKHSYATRKLIEEKANGAALISSLRKEISGLISVNPKDSKEARVHAISALIEAGNVYLPDAAWIDDYIDEFTRFPSGKHDDQVDSTSQALSDLHIRTIFKPEIMRPH